MVAPGELVFCSAKDKEPKDKSAGSRFGRAKRARRVRTRDGANQQAPDCRLFPALLTFDRGRQKGHPCPSGDARNPFRAPCGLFRPKAAVLDAANGRKTHISGRLNNATGM
jgi:hypothetical protein